MKCQVTPILNVCRTTCEITYRLNRLQTTQVLLQRSWCSDCTTSSEAGGVARYISCWISTISHQRRDLFGTVQAESANRGYLVTTSHFGPDAHEFAKVKNITLIDGPHLLHLFEKHGYKFRIDVDEARKLMGLT